MRAVSDPSRWDVVATWFANIVVRLDEYAFREHDRRVALRGWQVHRDRMFSRVVRHPLWDEVEPCRRCGYAVFGGAACAACADPVPGPDGRAEEDDDTCARPVRPSRRERAA
jgi:hypothetical protein